MKAFLLPLLMIGVCVFLYLSANASRRIVVYSLLLCFQIPGVFIFLLFGSQSLGLNSGGSIFVTLSKLIMEYLIFITALFSYGSVKVEKSVSQNIFSRGQLLVFGFLGCLFLIQIYESFTYVYKIQPIMETLLFLAISVLVVKSKIEYREFTESYIKLGAIMATLTFISFLTKFDWIRASNSFTSDNSGPGELTYFSPFANLFGFPNRLAGPFGSSQDMGIFCCFLFGLVVFSRNFSIGRQIFYGSIFIFLGSFTGSRTFYIGIIVALSLAFLQKIFINLNSNPVILAILFGTLLSYLVSLYILPLISQDEQNIQSFSGRKLLWQTILSHWSDNGPFGHGPNTLKPYMFTNTGQVAYGHAHNTFLQYLWDYGVLGCVLYAIFVIGFILLLGGVRVATKLEIKVHDVLYPFLLLLTFQSEPAFKIDMTYKGVYILIFIIGIREYKRNNAPNDLILR